MTIIKNTTSVFTLLLFSIIIGVSTQAQPQPNRVCRQLAVDQLTPMKVDANESFRLSDSELNQLIQQIENGGDNFRVSLTHAFSRRPYDRTRVEGNMNDALRGFKRATDQVRIRFDARQLISDDVKHLLDQPEGTVGNVDEGGTPEWPVRDVGHFRHDPAAARSNIQVRRNSRERSNAVVMS